MNFLRPNGGQALRGWMSALQGIKYFTCWSYLSSKRMASLIKSPIEESAVLRCQSALGSAVSLSPQHLMLSVWGLSELRKLWNLGRKPFLPADEGPKLLECQSLRPLLSVPFPSSRLPHTEIVGGGGVVFNQKIPSFTLKQLLPLLSGHHPTRFLTLPIKLARSLVSPWYCLLHLKAYS